MFLLCKPGALHPKLLTDGTVPYRVLRPKESFGSEVFFALCAPGGRNGSEKHFANGLFFSGVRLCKMKFFFLEKRICTCVTPLFICILGVLI